MRQIRWVEGLDTTPGHKARRNYPYQTSNANLTFESDEGK